MANRAAAPSRPRLERAEVPQRFAAIEARVAAIEMLVLLDVAKGAAATPVARAAAVA
jgi:hypothetical protein